MTEVAALAGRKFLIVGAGLAGTLAAIMLAQRGARVELIERSDLRAGAGLQQPPLLQHYRQQPRRGRAEGRRDLGTGQSQDHPDHRAHGAMTGTSRSSSPNAGDRSVALHGARRSDVNAALIEAASAHPNRDLPLRLDAEGHRQATGAVVIATVAETGPVEIDHRRRRRDRRRRHLLHAAAADPRGRARRLRAALPRLELPRGVHPRQRRSRESPS